MIINNKLFGSIHVQAEVQALVLVGRQLTSNRDGFALKHHSTGLLLVLQFELIPEPISITLLANVGQQHLETETGCTNLLGVVPEEVVVLVLDYCARRVIVDYGQLFQSCRNGEMIAHQGAIFVNVFQVL